MFVSSIYVDKHAHSLIVNYLIAGKIYIFVMTEHL